MSSSTKLLFCLTLSLVAISMRTLPADTCTWDEWFQECNSRMDQVYEWCHEAGGAGSVPAPVPFCTTDENGCVNGLDGGFGCTVPFGGGSGDYCNNNADCLEGLRCPGGSYLCEPRECC